MTTYAAIPQLGTLLWKAVKNKKGCQMAAFF
jgi:hypothetical protein